MDERSHPVGHLELHVGTRHVVRLDVSRLSGHLSLAFLLFYKQVEDFFLLLFEFFDTTKFRSCFSGIIVFFDKVGELLDVVLLEQL